MKAPRPAFLTALSQLRRPAFTGAVRSYNACAGTTGKCPRGRSYDPVRSRHRAAERRDGAPRPGARMRRAQGRPMTARPALPLITADGLTRAQRNGKSCACCRKQFPRPSVRAGITPAGEVLMRCPECVVSLELHSLIGPFEQRDRTRQAPVPAIPRARARARLDAPAPALVARAPALDALAPAEPVPRVSRIPDLTESHPCDE
jgi:hypothetical protein